MAACAENVLTISRSASVIGIGLVLEYHDDTERLLPGDERCHERNAVRVGKTRQFVGQTLGIAGVSDRNPLSWSDVASQLSPSASIRLTVVDVGTTDRRRDEPSAGIVHQIDGGDTRADDVSHRREDAVQNLVEPRGTRKKLREVVERIEPERDGVEGVCHLTDLIIALRDDRLDVGAGRGTVGGDLKRPERLHQPTRHQPRREHRNDAAHEQHKNRRRDRQRRVSV